MGDEQIINFRAQKELATFIEEMSDDWGVTKSETIRTIIRMHMGLLQGRFLSLLDEDLLDQWGDMGIMLKALKQSDSVSDEVVDARLKDVIGDGTILLGAEQVEVRNGNRGREKKKKKA